jgi:hypothetical protein
VDKINVMEKDYGYITEPNNMRLSVFVVGVAPFVRM